MPVPVVKILNQDVLEACKDVADNTFDSVFCDPPYGLSKTRNNPERILSAWLQGEDVEGSSGFMNKDWDAVVPGPTIWREIKRTMKPGAHLLAFGGTETVDYLTIALRLAGFEIRDCFMWMYGSGFPKGADISKAIDKKLGKEREVVGRKYLGQGNGSVGGTYGDMKKGHEGIEITAPASNLANSFDGYKTGLKPAYEPIIVAMKPKSGTYADNAIEYGVAGFNIDGSRIGTEEDTSRPSGSGTGRQCYGAFAHDGGDSKVLGGSELGRFPTNLILDEATGKMLDEQAGDEKSRFFYCAKASKAEREAGLHRRELQTVGDGREKAIDNPYQRGKTKRKNTHPCVKPLDLCRYFANLVLPPEREEDTRKILVPFSGSGSEMIGALLAGWDEIIGIEMDEAYCEIAEARLEHWSKEEETCK